ncbi:NUDIX hydrolase [Celeribacter neptunius]|uniref:ADP-ribose pyrophosphatase YjhB, NUDIX family n=1 Tax=Celeribacter neptunius TaxID=588602 RepID=A0A1I3JS41_9RHOB|nr:NUDIX hydrolase [Celeribacter neptunius]SFI63033.1 ADP-ribose pyrophosphatase YjhB, NUDIX family [Celeribacter neptunius]
MSQLPKLAVLAVCRKGDRLLLVQRRNPPDAGLWGFPGGHVELGERLSDAVVRELLEETGVTARAGAVLDHVELIERDGDAVAHHFLLVALACLEPRGLAKADDDAMDVRWATLAEMAGLSLSDHVMDLAEKALKHA